jgi:Tol biopolymer transport system component
VILMCLLNRSYPRCFWAFCLVAGFNLGVSAQPVKLSGTLVSGGDVSAQFALSPDGTRAVFIADKDTDGKNELYVVRLSNGVTSKLSGGNAVEDFQISPDSSRVIFRSIVPPATNFRLLSVGLGGGTLSQISGGFVTSGGGVLPGFQISPDGARVVFIADKEATEDYHLYSTPIASNTPTKLSGTLVSGGDVTHFQISSDSVHVVFRADRENNDVFELYSAPIAGGLLSKLSGTIPSSADVRPEFDISPDAARAVFLVTDSAINETSLFSTPTAGGARVQLAPDGDGFGAYEFKVTPDSATVIYLGDHDAAYNPSLFRTPIGSNAATKLADSFLTNGVYIRDWKLSADGTRVVFRVEASAGTPIDLYSTSVTSPAPINISGALVSGRAVTDFHITPDSSRVVFRADKLINEKFELFSTPISSADPVQISGSSLSTSDVETDFAISADSSRVVFRGNMSIGPLVELHSVAVTGGNRTVISGSMVPGSNVARFTMDHGASRVIFLADRETDEVFELYRVQIGGSALALDIDGDDRVLPLTDLLLLTRYQLGIRGSALIANTLGENATRTSSSAIEAELAKALGTARAP